MRTKVIEPTNGSSMILNARPANGALSSGTRTIFSLERGFVARPEVCPAAKADSHDRIQKRLHALVLEGGAAKHGNEAEADATLRMQA